GVLYSQPLVALDSAPVTWSLAPGSAMPPGLNLSGNTLAGMPTQAGSYNLSFSANDGGPTPLTLNLTLVVSTIHITTPDIIPQSIVTNVPYNFAMTATGGGTKTWTVSGQPSGITMSSSGVLSGTTTTNGTFRMTVTVTDGSSTYSHPFTVFANYS